jgi:hypothetical protein
MKPPMQGEAEDSKALSCIKKSRNERLIDSPKKSPI